MKKLLGILVLGLWLIPTLAISGTLKKYSEGHCRLNKNFIYYESIDKSDKWPKFSFHPLEKREFFKSFSLLVKSPGEYNSTDAEGRLVLELINPEEIIFNSDGIMTIINLKTCEKVETNWESNNKEDNFIGWILIGDSNPKKFGIKFSWSQNTIVHNNSSISFVRLAYPGKFSCDNTLNPICDQFHSTKYIVGFRNLIK